MSQERKLSLYRARCDASIRHGKRGIGFMIYDLNDEILYEHHELVEGYFNISQLEVYCVYRCLQELQRRNISQVKIRTDCKEVIDAIRGLHSIKSLSFWVDRIKEIEPDFKRIKYKWIPREFNHEADGLAREATERREEAMTL